MAGRCVPGGPGRTLTTFAETHPDFRGPEGMDAPDNLGFALAHTKAMKEYWKRSEPRKRHSEYRNDK